MDGESHSSIWSRLAFLLSGKTENQVAKAILDASTGGNLNAEEGSMLLSVLSLDEIQVQNIMTPRMDIDCLPTGTSLSDAAKMISESGHSRLPVYSETRDNIVGIAHAKDMLSSLMRHDGPEETVDAILREPFFIPETKIASELLQEFRTRKNHLAIVVDEYGGTSGLVTIEDLLEVIVGDIEDEHDAPKEEDIVVLSPDEYQLSGRAWLEDLDKLGMNLESDEVDTIGGYLSLEAGHLPQTGENFVLNGWNFTVTHADAKQIHKVLARREANAEVDAQE